MRCKEPQWQGHVSVRYSYKDGLAPEYDQVLHPKTRVLESFIPVRENIEFTFSVHLTGLPMRAYCIGLIIDGVCRGYWAQSKTGELANENLNIQYIPCLLGKRTRAQKDCRPVRAHMFFAPLPGRRKSSMQRDREIPRPGRIELAIWLWAQPRNFEATESINFSRLSMDVNNVSKREKEKISHPTHFVQLQQISDKDKPLPNSFLGPGQQTKLDGPPWMTFKFVYRREEMLQSYPNLTKVPRDHCVTIKPLVQPSGVRQPSSLEDVVSGITSTTLESPSESEDCPDPASSWKGSTRVDTDSENETSFSAASRAIQQREKQQVLKKRRITPFLEPTPSVRTFSPNPLFDSSDSEDAGVEGDTVVTDQAIAWAADQNDRLPRDASHEQQLAPPPSAIKREPFPPSDEDDSRQGRRSPRIKREINDDGDVAPSITNGTLFPADEDHASLTIVNGKKRKSEDPQSATGKRARTTAEETRQLIAERRRELEERRRMRIEAQEAAIAVEREALLRVEEECTEVETQIRFEEDRLQELRASLQAMPVT